MNDRLPRNGRILTLMVLFAAVSVSALDPSRAVTEYALQTWQEGLPQNTVHAIVQTPDGYIWFGTHEGLVRFDGSSFTVFDRDNTAAIKSNSIFELFVDSRGALWAGAFGTMFRYLDGEFVAFGSEQGFDVNYVTSIVETDDGVIWIGTNEGAFRFDGEFEKLGEAQGIPVGGIREILSADGSTVWMGSDAGELIHYVRPGELRTLDRQAGLSGDRVMALASDGTTVWAGTDGGGLVRVDGREVKTFTTKDGLSSDSVRSLAVDRNGDLWVGTEGGGLNRMSDGSFTVFSRDDGLPNDLVRAIHEDSEGSLWIGTNGGGLNCLYDSKFITYTEADGLSENNVRAVAELSDGSIWVGTEGGGVSILENGSVTNLTKRSGLAGNYIRSIYEDRQGRVWIGTNTEGVSVGRRGAFRTFDARHGFPPGSVTSIAEDDEGNIWVGTSLGLIRFRSDGPELIGPLAELPSENVTSLLVDRQGQLWVGTIDGVAMISDDRITPITPDQGLAGDFVFSIHEDTSGMIWVATTEGVSRIDGDEVRSYGVREGLHTSAIFRVIEDGLGYLWFTSNKGIARVARAQFDELEEGRLGRVEPTVFGTAEGLASRQCNGLSQPAGTRTGDGRLWFPLTAGLAVIDPARIYRNVLPPPVVIESIIVDGVASDPRGGARITAGGRRVEFRYAGLSFVSPSKVRFKYQLEGLDEDWIQAGRGRSAFYNDIPPGEYTFRVSAANADGVWNETGSAIVVLVDPRFTQTILFKAIVVVVLVSMVVVGHRVRLRSTLVRERDLTKLVEERTRQLEEANVALQQLSVMDALTGVGNRRWFDEMLEMEWNRARRLGECISVLMIDIDHFKDYNDSYGHLRGDECLKTVAAIMADLMMRASDFVARYGGEEFAAILPGISSEKAATLAEQLRSGVEGLNIPHDSSGTARVVTISVGGATIKPHKGNAAEDLIEAADDALYRAKRTGRNRIAMDTKLLRQAEAT